MFCQHDHIPLLFWTTWSAFVSHFYAVTSMWHDIIVATNCILILGVVLWQLARQIGCSLRFKLYSSHELLDRYFAAINPCSVGI